jgi:hypothetical protein
MLRERGYKQTLLPVRQNNPAVRFCERVGYKITGEKSDHAGHEDCITVKLLSGILTERVNRNAIYHCPKRYNQAQS